MLDQSFTPPLSDIAERVCRSLHGRLLGDPNPKYGTPEKAHSRPATITSPKKNDATEKPGEASAALWKMLSQAQNSARTRSDCRSILHELSTALAGALSTHPKGPSVKVLKEALKEDVGQLVVEQLCFALKERIGVGEGRVDSLHEGDTGIRLFEALTHWRNYVPEALSTPVSVVVQASIQHGFDQLLAALKAYPTDFLRGSSLFRFVEKGRLWDVFPDLPVALDPSLPVLDAKRLSEFDIQALGWEQALLDFAYALRRNPTCENIKMAASRYNQAVELVSGHSDAASRRLWSAVACLYAAFWQTTRDLERKTARHESFAMQPVLLGEIYAVQLAEMSFSPQLPPRACHADEPDPQAIQWLELLVTRRALEASLS